MEKYLVIAQFSLVFGGICSEDFLTPTKLQIQDFFQLIGV